MGKKKGRKRKSAIKSAKYKDYNISTIDQHDHKGKVLSPPFASVPFTFNSWLDEALPEVLWAVILASQLERGDYLDLFRQVVRSGREGVAKPDDTFISHSVLATLSLEDFDTILSPLLKRDDALELLAAMLLYDDLPDVSHWRNHLPEPDSDRHWQILGKAVADCFDHQSEKSTDCRWLKLTYVAAIGKLRFPQKMDDMIQHVIDYPNSGDLRSVRPFIRAGEMGLRAPDMYPGASNKWNSNFWKECWEKTKCHIREPGRPSPLSHRVTSRALLEIYSKVTSHFHKTLEGTSIDARHDGAFGLVLYGVYLTLALSRGDIAFRAEARVILRTLVETFITLKYLSIKDDQTIWIQYRNYGSGQTKLSFLKYITSDDVPEFLNLEELEMHANCDMWMEFQEINLGAWDNKNLRNMAQEAGVKDVYDKYYDWPSGFVHANWSAVRDTTFELCLNPLHRFHRVASFPRIDMNDALVDAGKLVNLLLDELNKLYRRLNRG